MEYRLVLLVMVVALATTNPLYLGIVLLSVLLVAAFAPRSGAGVTTSARWRCLAC